jgi:hypothetical protein
VVKKRRRKYYSGEYNSSKLTNPPAKFKSGWELNYMKFLDNDPMVKCYSYEPFFLMYISNNNSGKLRKYFPDFLIENIDGTKILVEVKPAKKVDNRVNKKKADAAMLWCREHGVNYKVVTEVELKKMKIL